MTDGHVRAAAVMVLALAADFLLGEPPNRWHPVAWIGRLLAGGQMHLEVGPPRALLVRGAMLVAVVGGLAGLAGWALSSAVGPWGLPGVIIEALALKLSICLRDLLLAARRVSRALERADVVGARRLVGHHLVSRRTRGLDASLVASATVESVAENLTDAFVGPLGCYLFLGLGGSYVYRVVNTADAMIGYREGALEYFGKVAARLDDFLNLVPARVAALAIVASAGLSGEAPCRAWRTMRDNHWRTASPNAGWTMSAMAGALGVTLEKRGAYRLGAGPLPGPEHIRRGVGVIFLAALLTVMGMVGALFLSNYFR